VSSSRSAAFSNSKMTVIRVRQFSSLDVLYLVLFSWLRKALRWSADRRDKVDCDAKRKYREKPKSEVECRKPNFRDICTDAVRQTHRIFLSKPVLQSRKFPHFYASLCIHSLKFSSWNQCHYFPRSFRTRPPTLKGCLVLEGFCILPAALYRCIPICSSNIHYSLV
jgi:hypothetical protein